MILRPAAEIYRDCQNDRKLYVCHNYPACNTYVAAHPGTNQPMGVPANGDLRNLRIQAHRKFDRIWQTGIMTRENAYYRTIKGEHYECIEGTLVREQAGYARKRHMIVLALEDGSLEQRILEGRYKLKIGTDYRFYLKREPIAEIQIELPEILQPAIIVLGHEELPFSSGKQI